jgi:hypothetical protein
MPRHKPKAHELTTSEAMRKMFPKKAREALALEAEKARKPKEKASTKKDSS